MFCSVKCRQSYRNDPSRNPSRSPEAKLKISRARKGNPTSLGIPCPEDKKRKISEALKGRNLSEEQKTKIRQAMTFEIRLRISNARKKRKMPSGESHPMWKGGLAKLRETRYKEPEYIEFVNACLKRDNYTCQWCNARSGLGQKVVLQVHHKIHYWERPDLAYDIDNGVTLCKSCHQKAHKGMKRTDIPMWRGQARICRVCGIEFRVKEGGRKYCSSCRQKYCCPVCGSTNCSHSARKALKQSLPF